MRKISHKPAYIVGLIICVTGCVLKQTAVAQTLAPRKSLAPRKLQPLGQGHGTGMIVGRVVYDDGRPAAGITIAAAMQTEAASLFTRRAHLDGRYRGSWRAMARKQTTTSADGTYRFTGLALAPYNVYPHYRSGSGAAAGPAGWVASALEGITPRPKPGINVPALRLVRGTLIRGRVVDQETQEPLKNLVVSSRGPHRPRSGNAEIQDMTDAQGRFTLRIAPGKSRIYINGYTLARQTSAAASLVQERDFLTKYNFFYADDRSPAFPQQQSLRLIVLSGAHLYSANSGVVAIIGGEKPQRLFGSELELETFPSGQEQSKDVAFRLRRVVAEPK